MRGIIVKFFWLLAICATGAASSKAQEAREFTLSMPAELMESGLMDYLLPRFALKTGRRATVVEEDADVVVSDQAGTGTPVMTRGEAEYSITTHGTNDAARRFAKWITSEVGQSTIIAFVPEGGPPFGGAAVAREIAAETFDGDVKLGQEVASAHCARCHRTHAKDRSSGIGSTPSFPALRALRDWEERFTVFYALNPHPAFLRVTDVSPPFDPARPPPIIPVEITLDEVEALIAYAASVAPADLGGAIVHQ